MVDIPEIGPADYPAGPIDQQARMQYAAFALIKIFRDVRLHAGDGVKRIGTRFNKLFKPCAVVALELQQSSCIVDSELSQFHGA